MKKYRILVEGTDILMKIDDQLHTVGFFTTRFITGKHATDAGEQTLHLIKEELSEITVNTDLNPPVLRIEEIQELHSFAGVDIPGKGLIFYFQ